MSLRNIVTCIWLAHFFNITYLGYSFGYRRFISTIRPSHIGPLADFLDQVGKPRIGELPSLLIEYKETNLSRCSCFNEDDMNTKHNICIYNHALSSHRVEYQNVQHVHVVTSIWFQYVVFQAKDRRALRTRTFGDRERFWMISCAISTWNTISTKCWKCLK